MNSKLNIYYKTDKLLLKFTLYTIGNMMGFFIKRLDHLCKLFLQIFSWFDSLRFNFPENIQQIHAFWVSVFVAHVKWEVFFELWI